MEKFETPIGDKEPEKLQAKLVKVVGKKIEMQQSRGKDIGEKVTLVCKHPDREETIDISQTKYLKSNKIKISGLWFKLDDDEKIFKGSALALTMNHYRIKTVAEFEGKDIETVEDENGYLCVKAY